MKSIDQEIEAFIMSIQHLWKDKPLSEDETSAIVEKVRAELNFHNGNDEQG